MSRLMAADLVRTLTGRLAGLFAESRDDKRAAAMSAYMRDLFPFFGIPGPAQQQIGRAATAGLPAPSPDELKRVALACWERQEREWQYFACGYLRRHVAGAPATFLSTARRLITHKPWWDTVDSLAARTVGPLVTNHPDLVSTMDRWIGSRDFWLARTAILHQLHAKSATDADRLFSYCLHRAADREFFIRKAIGWALREYSKTDEHAVRGFVSAHASDLSGLSRTEALKWLERRKYKAGPRSGVRFKTAGRGG